MPLVGDFVMRICEECKGFGLIEVPQPNGDRDTQECDVCEGYGCIFETDQEVESARIAGML
jgi:DnaJ-class molecular chaperone